MQMDWNRYPMKRSNKGKKPIFEHDYGRVEEDDELDIDDVLLEFIEHHSMMEEMDNNPPELSILGSGTAPPTLVMPPQGTDERWRLGSDVVQQGRKLDPAAAALHMQPLGGALEQNHNEIGLTGFGPRQTNLSVITQELSSSFSRMNMSSIKGTIDLGSSSTRKNASFQNQYHNVGSSSSPSSNYKLGGYDVNSYIPLIQRDTGNLPNSFARAVELQNLYRAQTHIRDQLYLQSLRSSKHIASQAGNFRALANSNVELPEFSNAYHAVVSSIQSPQPEVSLLQKAPAAFKQDYFGRSVYGPAMPNPGSPFGGSHGPMSPHQSVGPLSRGVMGSGNSISISNLERRDVSLVVHELLKNNTTKIFKLVDVAGHFVELSMDQHGSRFIQQKLATASPEEMDLFLNEILPQAQTLIVDVFGNYVIQKLFDYGSKYHIRELANQMTGHVYQFSLQMFSCRVIQKGLEVIEVDKRIKLVSELEGHVLRLIRDQNGNHVIQKCIEHVPEVAIKFILSVIFDQIIPLSTHAYGCRIIQRVLEYCSQNTQKTLTYEIVQYVTMLADDMYGNYVVQHVLENGKPQVRSAIIKNLAGQIVHMSTLKYASNVVEKCLTYCTPAERKSLVDEMLYLSPEYDALQLMIKDQYANYVVQRVLQTCDEEQIEQILNRIKVHINALHEYPYAKHIVPSLEKLIITGESRHHILNSAYAEAEETCTDVQQMRDN